MEYGIIDETSIKLVSPRPVDATRPTLNEAFAVALDWLKDGAEEVTIVRARHSKRLGCMVEDGKHGCITLDTTELKESFFG